MTFPVETETLVTLTRPAAQAIRNVMEEKNLQGYALRLYISGGGCSGFQYGMALDNNIRPEDTTVITDDIKLIVDEVSIKYLQGATVDYVDGLEGSGFKIINPNVSSSCSCSQGDQASDDCGGGSCSGCG